MISAVTALDGTITGIHRTWLDPSGAVIDATAAFGGIDILVPEGWRVTASGIPIFGGFESKTKAPPPSEDVPKLTVRGLALFGGVTVKHQPED